ncbi:MAG: deoxyribodipyrimidine photolyase [Chloroflexi bacterium RBG_16_48_8]|nr:MAG: deoxyribodipyrimidine photolyase [Chloroflexi bacterium RBG_16_48_8]
MKTILWWVRRDLQLIDNETLFRAVQHADLVTPTFILDPNLIGSSYVGEKRLGFLYAGLQQLNADLQELGSQLILRKGHPLEVFEKLRSQTNFDVIYAKEDFSPFAQKRDSEVRDRFPIEFFRSPTFRHPLTVRKENGKPYTVYTPYSRAWKALPLPSEEDLLPKPQRIHTPQDLETLPIPPIPASLEKSCFVPGESEAQRRLKAFIEGDPPAIYGYRTRRDRMDLDGTSQLSPYLRYGMLSAKQAIVAAAEAMSKANRNEDHQAANTWLNELIWREFYLSILFNFPHVRKMSFRETLSKIQWEKNPTNFKAWCSGETGYPIVDAAMRQLAETGWMYNRARMIVASFLVKDLLIDWRWGERWFMQHLIDGNPAANNGGWQWSAGTGTDAAPYFRVFNPILQGQKFDSQGEYVVRWMPELSSVPIKYLLTPWEMPLDLQKSKAVVIGRDYPKPIVDHSFARERVLERFRLAKEKAEKEKGE